MKTKKNKTKWGKNYKKPTKSFIKNEIICSLRQSIFTAMGLPVHIFSRYEGNFSTEINIADQYLQKDLEEMKKVGIQFASKLPRKAKKKFKRGLKNIYGKE